MRPTLSLPCHATCPALTGARASGRQRGFTLIELIMVILMVGVLAVFVVPRMDVSGFTARGFHDETLALLRYAQKTAIAQRRTVCLAFGTTSATLTVASAAATTTCNTALVGPRGTAAISARSGVQYNSLPANFYFDGLGQPSAGQTFQVANVSASITVEPGTGYVHE
jgi:MSHA pilin protein MshC